MKKNADDTETAIISSSEKVILDILERDIAAHPERLQPVTAEQVRRVTVVDDATREAVVIEVERAISGPGVTRVMDCLALSRGLPKVTRSANGKEFCGRRWWPGRTNAECGCG
jgi:hypothetical protein